MSIAQCVLAAAESFGVRVADIRSRSREQRHSWPRQAAMWLAKCEGNSNPKIGHHMDRDHTSVIYACRQVERRFDEDEEFGDALLDAYMRRFMP